MNDKSVCEPEDSWDVLKDHEWPEEELETVRFCTEPKENDASEDVTVDDFEETERRPTQQSRTMVKSADKKHFDFSPDHWN